LKGVPYSWLRCYRWLRPLQLASVGDGLQAVPGRAPWRASATECHPTCSAA